MPPIAFVPMAQNPGLQPWAPVLVRSSMPLSGMAAPIVQRVKALNPALAVQFTELKSQISERLIAERTTAWLAGAFGVLAIVMVTVGLYGIIAYLTVSRRNEIGIRLSLGSTRAQIVMLVLRDSLWPLALGLAHRPSVGGGGDARRQHAPLRPLADRSDDDGWRHGGACRCRRTRRVGPGLAGGACRSRHRPALRLTCPSPRRTSVRTGWPTSVLPRCFFSR